jgi:hypothetical protein
MASRERRRAAERRSVSAFCRAWLDRTRLMAHNLMQPLALPFAGGVFSALVLFGAWWFRHIRCWRMAAPMCLRTEHLGFGETDGLIGMSNADMVVDVLNDEQF